MPAAVFAKLRPGAAADSCDHALCLDLVHHEMRRRELVKEVEVARETLSHTEEAEKRSLSAFTNIASLPEYAALEEQIARGEQRELRRFLKTEMQARCDSYKGDQTTDHMRFKNEVAAQRARGRVDARNGLRREKRAEAEERKAHAEHLRAAAADVKQRAAELAVARQLRDDPVEQQRLQVEARVMRAASKMAERSTQRRSRG